ncbi:MAG: hypothetical protein Q8N58_01435 [bacterium]|nr:hypothetical protein [bacterium]
MKEAKTEEVKKPTGVFKCVASHVSDGSELIQTGKIWVCPTETRTGICLHSVRKVCFFSKNELVRLPQDSFLIT